MKIAVIGSGYWGSKIASTLNTIGHQSQIIDVKNGQTIDDIDDCEASIVATPARDHFTTTMKLLKKGLHCLVEKPIAMNYNEVLTLKVEAQEHELTLMAGHVLCYSELVHNLKMIYLQENILHIESRRLNWGRIQYDISPIPHLAPHDVAVLDYVFDGAMPESVTSKGYRFDSREYPDYVVSDLDYGDFTVQLQMGWYYPVKTRTITTITDQGHYIWNDVEGSWKFIANYMSGKYQKTNENMNTHYIDTKEKTPVANEIEHFIDCVINKKTPTTGGEHALRVTHIIDHMERSLKIEEPCTIIY